MNVRKNKLFRNYTNCTGDVAKTKAVTMQLICNIAYRKTSKSSANTYATAVLMVHVTNRRGCSNKSLTFSNRKRSFW